MFKEAQDCWQCSCPDGTKFGSWKEERCDCAILTFMTSQRMVHLHSIAATFCQKSPTPEQDSSNSDTKYVSMFDDDEQDKDSDNEREEEIDHDLVVSFNLQTLTRPMAKQQCRFHGGQ